MDLLPAKAEILQQLQREIRSLQRLSAPESEPRNSTGLGIIEQSFPDQRFPTGAVHELLSFSQEEAAATTGFLAGLLHGIIASPGTCLWVSTRRTIFPPALKAFGIAPERIIFIDAIREKEALWAIEEGLKCKALAAVIGELKEVSFTESRRLQLAVEQSHVTGFIHRHKPRTENTTAFVSRWKIRPIASAAEEELPGLGFPRWQVQLQRVRNGKPGSWQIEWTTEGFRQLPLLQALPTRKNILKTA